MTAKTIGKLRINGVRGVTMAQAAQRHHHIYLGVTPQYKKSASAAPGNGSTITEAGRSIITLNGLNEYVTYEMPILDQGNWRLSFAHSTGVSYGNFRILMGKDGVDTALGADIVGYQSGAVVHGALVTRDFVVNDYPRHRLMTFKVVGKEAASSAYNFRLSLFVLDRLRT